MATSSDQIRTFEELTESQRAVAWAVVRSMATALWAALYLTASAWVFLTMRAGDALMGGPAPALLIGAAAFCGVLELKARDLEKRDLAPGPEPKEEPAPEPGLS